MNEEEIIAIAKEVIAGKWGNGSERLNRLMSAGKPAYLIQNKVNELLESGYDASEQDKMNLKSVEIDARGYDGLVITLVVD